MFATTFTLDAPTILAIATLLGVIGSVLVQLRNGSKQDAGNIIATNTNRMVNGAHGVALQTISQLTNQIAQQSGKSMDAARAVEAEQAVAEHAAGAAAVEKGKTP